jgi:hypothetical protein
LPVQLSVCAVRTWGFYSGDVLEVCTESLSMIVLNAPFQGGLAVRGSRGYSYRSATMGSTRAARTAGM